MTTKMVTGTFTNLLWSPWFICSQQILLQTRWRLDKKRKTGTKRFKTCKLAIVTRVSHPITYTSRCNCACKWCRNYSSVSMERLIVPPGHSALKSVSFPSFLSTLYMHCSWHQEKSPLLSMCLPHMWSWGSIAVIWVEIWDELLLSAKDESLPLVEAHSAPVDQTALINKQRCMLLFTASHETLDDCNVLHNKMHQSLKGKHTDHHQTQMMN